MPVVYVCPLSQIEATVASTRASHLVTLINDDTLVVRPRAIDEGNHLFLGINDITEAQEGMVLPAEEHVATLIDFVQRWDRQAPIVIHCYAGISRSTAAAFIALCALQPERDEAEIARTLRSASRSATPNPRLVALADDLLERNGRMVEAIAAIGRGEMAVEGVPFALALEIAK
ncbi:MAG TPA: tyrosine phosphatase family protein [Bauldia sp.]|nr:tyrosine phosphatase family protein [Bauldia sp.]